MSTEPATADDTRPATRLEIVLIGPIAAGKSTVAALLAEALGVPHASLDAVAWPYYAEAGWSRERFREVYAREGLLAAHRQLAPALVHAVERFLPQHRGEVIDLGAGHTHFDDPQ